MSFWPRTRQQIVERVIDTPRRRSQAPSEDRRRRCVTDASVLYSGYDYEGKLRASLKDYARGRCNRDEAPFFTFADDLVTASDAFKAMEDQPHVYRIFFRPYESGGLVTREFVREFVRRFCVKAYYPADLLFFAAIHQKKTAAFDDHKHFHIVLPARYGFRKIIRLKPYRLKNTLKEVGVQLLTEKLGPMSDQELLSMRIVSQLNRGRSERMNQMRREGRQGWEVQREFGLSR